MNHEERRHYENCPRFKEKYGMNEAQMNALAVKLVHLMHPELEKLRNAELERTVGKVVIGKFFIIIGSIVLITVGGTLFFMGKLSSIGAVFNFKIF